MSDDSEYEEEIEVKKPAAVARSAGSSGSGQGKAAKAKKKKPPAVTEAAPESPKATTKTSPSSKAAKKGPSSADKAKKKRMKKKAYADHGTQDDYDILLPSSSANGGGTECTVLVQVDPADAHELDFHGATGAVGRIETEPTSGGGGVVFDVKGRQYRGTLYPGATAMVLTVVRPTNFTKKRKGRSSEDGGGGGGDDDDNRAYIKVDGITDEFCRLVGTGREHAMDRMNAVVRGALGDDYRVLDEDVNRNTRMAPSDNNSGAVAADNNPAKKQKGRAASSGVASSAKRKAGKAASKVTAGIMSKKRKTS